MDSFEHAIEKANEALRQEKQGLETALEYWKAKTAEVERERDEWKASHARQEKRADEAETHADAMAKERDEARQERDLAYSNGVGGAAKRIQELQAERDEAQRALLLEQQMREAHREAAEDLLRRVENAEQERNMAVRSLDTCERMRAEWKASSADWEAVAKREKARAEAAEADNAALVSELARIGGWAAQTRQPDLEVAIRDLLENPHPGAALLERLQAAERVVEAARVGHAVMPFDAPSTAALEAALAAYNAVKEGK